MPEKNNNLETPAVAKTRQQRIEEFLLNPDKTIFESMEQFETAVTSLVEILSAVDIDSLETLQGKDGYTPVRGVDYFTDDDVSGLEAFIISKIPTVGVDLPSVEQVKTFISNEVAKIPRVQGDKGDAGRPGKDGKDGSPDTGEKILEKLRGLPKNKRLKISDIRGLENSLRSLVNTADEFEELKKSFEERMVVFNGPGSGGGEGNDVDAIHINEAGEFSTITEDSTPEAGSYFIYEAATGGGKFKIKFSDIVGSGDMQASVYDPTNVAGDAFDMDNMSEGTDTKIMNAAERTKIGNITVPQAVDLDQMETDIAALANGMVYKGDWDASAGTFPGSDVAQIGWFYTVSVGGTVDSVIFNIGDRLIATADNASSTTYAGNWTSLDATDAVTSVAGRVGNVTLDTDDIAEGANLYHTTARVLATALTGLSVATNAVVEATDTILVGIGKLQAQITGYAASALTFTNKRIQPRTASSTSSATLTPDLSSANLYFRTTQTTGLTVNAPIGTPVIGETISGRISAASAQTLTMNATYIPFGAAFPADLTAGKDFSFTSQYNGTNWMTLWAEEQ